MPQNHTNQSNLSLQDHPTLPGLWMAESGRTPSPQPHNKCPACCQHSWPRSDLVLPGLGQSCALAPGAARALCCPCCCSLPALSWHVWVLTFTDLHVQVDLYTSPSRNLTYKESIIHWETVTRDVSQRINNKLVPFCTSSLHEMQACDIFFFLNSRRLSSYILVSLSIFFSLS